jgi:hypothetical protein
MFKKMRHVLDNQSILLLLLSPRPSRECIYLPPFFWRTFSSKQKYLRRCGCSNTSENIGPCPIFHIVWGCRPHLQHDDWNQLLTNIYELWRASEMTQVLWKRIADDDKIRYIPPFPFSFLNPPWLYSVLHQDCLPFSCLIIIIMYENEFIVYMRESVFWNNG